MNSKCFWTIVIIVISFPVYGQESASPDTLPSEVILNKLVNYNKTHPSLLLFLHTDKTVYTNNETIWFSAYLISKSNDTLIDHNILSVLLINEDNPSSYLQSKYSLESGKGAGSILLPDSIVPGHYQLVAYTNVVDLNANPVVIFKQAITIKSTNSSDFIASAKLLDSTQESGTIRIQVSVKSNEGNIISGANVSYQLDKNIFKSSSTNNSGNSIISLSGPDLKSNEILISVLYKNRRHYFSLALPQKKRDSIIVHFFPEGGNLCNGTVNTVAWETKTFTDTPIPVRAILYNNEKIADTISTDAYGYGKFKIFSTDSAKFRIEVINNKYPQENNFYQLPDPLNDLVSLHIDTAVINDSVHFTISSPNSKTINVLVHNYRQVFAFFPLTVNNKDKKVTVALNDMPKGVAAITILDFKGRPLAERLFFAHHDWQISASIKTDEVEYSPHDKITINLKITDQKLNLVDGSISIACIQASRIEQATKQDINSYFYFTDDLGHLPYSVSNNLHNDRELLENILLTKGWRRYKWQDVITISKGDISNPRNFLAVTGAVRSQGRPLANNTTLALVSDSSLKIINTDKTGAFTLNNEDLMVRYNRKSWLLVNNKSDYDIIVQDPYLAVNKKLSAELQKQSITNSIISGTAYLTDFEKAITLSDVTIKSKKTFHPFFERNSNVKGFNTNACGDYVCAMYGDLNCPLQFHDLTNTLAPIKGKLYHKLILNQEGELIMWFWETYKGCSLEESNTKFFYIPVIYQSREFYGADYDSPSAPQTQFLTTLYWNPAVEVRNGEAICTFHAGDIKGKFNIVVQGISSNDVINGEASFSIKK